MSGDLSDTYRWLIIKVGSSLLIGDDGELDKAWLSGLAADVAVLRDRGCDVLIVSSGAIAIGSHVLGLNRRKARLPDLQAAAAAGQVQLAASYRDVFGQYGTTTAQVLLTLSDTENRRRFLNARSTLERLIDSAVVPVINENDTVATEEIRYGDNDRLAARVAQLVMADGLVLLSDVDGFYTADPGVDPAAEHIAEIQTITESMLAMAGDPRSGVGSGGMTTKLQAARIATHAGCSTIIADGTVARPLAHLATGARSSIFHAQGTPAAARKQWLAGSLRVLGRLRVDAGAVRALARGSSLLPVGILAVDGAFQRGDAVAIIDPDGHEIGRGLAEYGAKDAQRLIGCHSEDIEQVLGYRGRSVMLHRNELVLFDHEH